MSEQANAPKAAPSSSPQQQKNIVNPHDHDVLSGRGNYVNYHAGNEHFRALVKKHKIAYVACPKSQKGKFSRIIVDEIRSMNPPGRFLKQDASTKLWHDIGDKKALDKTRQALREGAPELLKELHGSDEEAEGDPENYDAGVNDQFVSLAPASAMRNPTYTNVGSVNGVHSVLSSHQVLSSTQMQPPLALTASQLEAVARRRDMIQAATAAAAAAQRQHMGLSHSSPPLVNQMDSGSQNNPASLSLQNQNAGWTRGPTSPGTSKGGMNVLSKQELTVSYPADQFEPTPINPDLAPVRSGEEQDPVTIKMPASSARVVPVRELGRQGSLKLADLYKGPLVKSDRSGMAASSGNMSFSIGDLASDASNLSAVFEDSLVIADGSKDTASKQGKKVASSEKGPEEKAPDLAKSSNSMATADMSFSMSQTVDFLGSTLEMSLEGGFDGK